MLLYVGKKKLNEWENVEDFDAKMCLIGWKIHCTEIFIQKGNAYVKHMGKLMVLNYSYFLGGKTYSRGPS